MRLPEPLRYSPFALRRRSSPLSPFHGERPGPILPVDNTRNAGAAIGYSPPVYMGGLPKEYVPDIGPMHVPASDYQPYDAVMPPVRHAGPVGGMEASALGLGPAGMSEHEVTYEDGLVDEDLIAIQLKIALGQYGGTPIVPDDNHELAHLFPRGPAAVGASEFDHDLQAHLSEIQMAVEQIRAQPLADGSSGLPSEALYGHETMMYQPAVTEPIGGAFDPSRYEPQDLFAREVEMIERQFASPGPSHQDFSSIDALVAAQDTFFGPPPEAVDLVAGPEPANLEGIIDAHDMPSAMMPHDMAGVPSYDGCPMTPDLFNQQMQDALGAMGPQGIYGDPALLGYDMPGTYDEQMMRMMDPYAMPGMYDPMLPGPMPDFGPGGGP